MFNLSNFIMETLKGMVGNYPDFQVREFALGWYSRKKLTEKNLEELELILNPPSFVVTEDEVMEGEMMDEGAIN